MLTVRTGRTPTARLVAAVAAITLTFTAGNLAAAVAAPDPAVGPANLTVGHYYGYDQGNDVVVDAQAQLAYLADATAGVQVLDVSDRTAPARIAHIPAHTNATSVVHDGAALFVLDGTTLRAVDIGEPSAPRELTELEVGSATSLAASDSLIAVIGGESGLRIVDATDPGALIDHGPIPRIGSVELGGLTGTTAYAFDGSALRVLDVTDPASPNILATVPLPAGSYRDLAVDSGRVYLTSDSSLVAVDVADPTDARLLWQHSMDNSPSGLFVQGDRAYVGTAGGSNNTVVLDISGDTPTTLRVSYSFLASGSNWFGVNTNRALVVADGYAYLANRFVGLQILDLDADLAEPDVSFRDHPAPGLTPVDLEADPQAAPAVTPEAGVDGTFVAPPVWDIPGVLTRTSDAVAPDNVFTVFGEGLAGADIVAVDRADGEGEPDPPAGAQHLDPVDVDAEGQTASAVLPESTPSGAYRVWVHTDAGWTAPIVLNGARPAWLTQDEAAPGLQVSVVGKNLDLAEIGGSTATRVMLSDGEHAYEAPVDDVTPFKVAFRVPEVPVGTYTVIVSNDGEVWRSPSDGRTLSIVEPVDDPVGLGVSWAREFVWDATFSVDDYGATGDGSADDAPAIQSAIDAAGDAGGGVVWLPNGTYRLLSGLTLPAKVVLRGESQAGTVLSYEYTGTDRLGAVIGMQEPAVGRVGIADLTLRIAPDAPYDYPIWFGDAWGAGIDDIEARQSEYIFVVGSRIQTAFHRLAAGRSFATIVIARGHVKISRNDFSGYQATVSSSYTGEYGDLSHNDFVTTNSNAGMQTYTTFTDNRIVRNPFAATTPDTAQGIWGRGNTYFAGNDVTGTGQPTSNDGEILAVESYRAGTKMYGTVESASPTTVVVNPATAADGSLLGERGVNNWNVDRRSFGHWSVIITRGTGLGQLRRVTAADAGSRTLTVDRPWDVQPDATSAFSVMVPNTSVIIHDNTVRDGAKGLWLYGSNYDGAIVGNTGVNVEGALANSIQSSTRQDVNYFHRIDGNTFTGGGTKGGFGAVGVQVSMENGGTSGYVAYGIALRENTIQHVRDTRVAKDASEAPNINGVYVAYESRVEQSVVRPVMKAVVVEHNAITDTDRGVTVGWGNINHAWDPHSDEPFSSGVLVRANQFRNVDVTYVDPGTTDTTLLTPIDPAINLAFRRPVTVSSGQGAGQVTDGDLEKGWRSGPRAQQWVAVDLGAPATLRELRLAWGGGRGGVRDYTVYVDDGAGWRAVARVKHGDGLDDVVALDNVVASKVRVEITGGRASRYELRELEVFGLASPQLTSGATSQDGGSVVLRFDRRLAPLPPGDAGFSVTATAAGSDPVEVSVTAELGADPATVTLGLATAVTSADSVAVSYTPGDVASTDGGRLAAIAGMPVTNAVPPPPDPAPPGTELLANPGFEAGTSSWYAFAAGELGPETQLVHSGSAAARMTSRGQLYSGPAQDVRQALYDNGPGTFRTTAWVRLGAGADIATVSLRIVTSTSQPKWFVLARGAVGAEGYAPMTGTADVSWTGRLTEAAVYVETRESKSALYVDDASLVLAPTDASLSPTWAEFDKAAPADVRTTVTSRESGGVSAVSAHGEDIGPTAWSLEGTVLTLRADALAGFDVGRTVFTVKFEAGADATFVVTIRDSTPPAEVRAIP